MRQRRDTPRRRSAPRWSAEEWAAATLVLSGRCRSRCDWCREPLGGRAARHHRQRRRDGGDRYANLVMLHPHCHDFIHRHPDTARRLGFIVPSWIEDVAGVPLLLGGIQWYRLDDDGSQEPV